jgi:hypothetical protein
MIFWHEFGTDFNPFPPGHIHDGCLIRSLRATYWYHAEESDRLVNYLDHREIPYHWEFIRFVVDTKPDSWYTKYTVYDTIVLHVYSDNDALEARLHTDARPLDEGWRARMEVSGIADGDYVN